MFSKKGFTLIELVMIIVILGILAATAIPRYVDLRTQALEASEKGVAGGVRGGIMTYYAEYRAFPSTLDSASAGDCLPTNACFDRVIEGGITEGRSDDGWEKNADDTYTGPRDSGSWAYTSTDGTFLYTP